MVRINQVPVFILIAGFGSFFSLYRRKVSKTLYGAGDLMLKNPGNKGFLDE